MAKEPTLIEEIRNYEGKKYASDEFSKEEQDIIRFLKTKNEMVLAGTFQELIPNSNCWAQFAQRYNFAKYAAISASQRSRYVIYPNPKGEYFMTSKYAFLFGRQPKTTFLVEYDFRSGIVALEFYDILMLDYDIKEGITREQVLQYLTDIVQIAKSVNVNLVFIILPSDRGVHAFLVSHYYDRNLLWIDFMLNLCNDANYTAFSYARGFGVRLSKKPENPDDLVAWITPMIPPDDEEYSIDEDSPYIEVDSQYLAKSIRMTVFSKELTIIGDRSYMMDEIYSRVQLHYLLVQYFRSMTLLQIKTLECDIYNSTIFHTPNDPFPNIIDRMNLLREDMAYLAEINIMLDLNE